MFKLKNGQDLDELASVLDKISERWGYVDVCRERYGLPSSLRIADSAAVCAINSYMGVRVSNSYLGVSGRGVGASFASVQDALRFAGFQPWLLDYIAMYGDLRVKAWYLSLAPAWSEECELL